VVKKTRKIRAIGIMTGGGDCPGLNAVIRAVTKTAVGRHGLRVFGILDGFEGLIENRIHELHWDDVSNILTEGGTILGTSNKANPAHYAVTVSGRQAFRDVRSLCVRNARAHGLDAIIAIGGDGTMTGAAALAEKGLGFIGVPKTIDNDLAGTEITFGFNTAVTTATDALDKVHTTASSHHRVMIVEVMGRYAGWIALYAGVASGADVILIPEIPYRLEKVCQSVIERRRRGRRFSIITVSEGAREKGGQYVVRKTITNSPDPIRLGGIANKLADDIEKAAGLECRATILGHVQRGGSPTPFDRTLATGFGHAALELLMRGGRNRVVVQQRGQITSAALSSVAGKIRTVPKNYYLLRAAREIGTSFGD
jgi:ATP-dependent phosphofructokinase / diphosphate-dependent phosphofructokinase